MKHTVLALAALAMLASCGPSPLPGGKRIADGVYWRLNALGDGERFPSDSDSAFVRVRVAFRGAPPGSLFSTERWYGMAGSPDIGVYFAKLRTGDSATVMVQADKLPWAQLGAVRPATAKDTSWIEMEIAMRGMRSLEQSRAVREALLQARTRVDEDSILNVFLADTAQHWKKAYGILYQMSPGKPKGPLVQYGEQVTLTYTARFLENGTVFDHVTATGGGLQFRLGDPGQVIKGLEIATSLLPRNGGKGRFIIPSELGFGPFGSSSGIVPPWTPLLYEVEVLPTKAAPKVSG